MKPLVYTVLTGVLLGTVTVGVDTAQAGERKHWKRGPAYDYRDYRGGYDHDDRDYDGRCFSHREVYVVREYYRPRYRAVPPGLRRYYYRRGYLPPGWQRRIEPYPVFLERDVVVLPRGYRRGIIDGHAVIYNGRGAIIDIAVLF